jgi:tetratricopeptide (TPR) repeat protein
MKTVMIKACALFSIIGVSMLVVQCSSAEKEDEETTKDTTEQQPKEAPKAAAIPKMQDRKAIIGSPEELNQLLDIYDNSRLALEANPNDIEARLRMAEVFIQEARLTGDFGYNYTTALGLLEDVIKASGENKDALFQALTHKATIKLSQHQFKAALRIGKDAVAINGHNSGVYGVLVDANVELGNYQEAVKMSDKMVNIRPDLRSYSRISYLREIHGENEGAIEAMKLAVSAGYPGFEETSWCRVMLGGLHEKAGDLTNAAMQYQLALQERENYPYALAAMGRIEMKKTNYEEAEKLISKAITYMPNAGFYADLSKTQQLNGNAEGAAENLKLAFATLRGDGADHHHDNGHSHGEGDHHSNGHTHGHGHSHEVGLEMAKMYLEFTEVFDKALTNALHEYDIRPENVEVNQVLAGIYFMKEDYEKAAEHLRKAMATNAQNPQLDCLGGLLKIKTGDEAEGKELITKSFAADPYQTHFLAKDAKSYL